MRMHSEPTDRATTTSTELAPSKAHGTKVPQEWTTWNATIGETTQEEGTTFTWPQVCLRSFLRSDPQCSCIHKIPRREDWRWPPLPLPWPDICKRGNNKSSQKSEKPGKSHTQKREKQKKKTRDNQSYTNRRKRTIFPRPFGWISKPGLIIKLRFDKCQIPIFSWPFEWIFKSGLTTQLRFWQSVKS